MKTYTEEPCEGKLSCTVLKTSTGSDPAAEFDTGRACMGSHEFPADASRVPEAFFESYFSAVESTGRGRSRRHPDDVGQLWNELHGQASFPLGDLVPHGTVAEIMRIGR